MRYFYTHTLLITFIFLGTLSMHAASVKVINSSSHEIGFSIGGKNKLSFNHNGMVPAGKAVSFNSGISSIPSITFYVSSNPNKVTFGGSKTLHFDPELSGLRTAITYNFKSISSITEVIKKK